MKKSTCIFLVLTLVILSACSQSVQNYQDTQVNNNSANVILPQVNVQNRNAKLVLKQTINKSSSGLTVIDKIGENYYGVLSEYNEKYGGIVNTDVIYNSTKDEITPISYPNNLSNWQVSSGSYVVLEERYLYEWKCYSTQSSKTTVYDMKLTCIDTKDGKVSIVYETELTTPLVYLYKIDDKKFLSYYLVQTESENTEYATLTVAEVISADGTSKEIIREVYENNVNWENSTGTLLERLVVFDGNIYGFGRKRIDNKYRFFFYRYTLNGEFIDEEYLSGFDEIIKSEQPLDFFLTDDYIIIRTYESLSTFICQMTDDGVDLIAKGENGNISYGFNANIQSLKYVFFIEKNVDDNDKIKNKDCPLYVINTQSKKISTIKISVPLENPYFVSFQMVSDGDLLVTYCENGSYDPLNKKIFNISNKELTVLLNNPNLS